MSTYFWLIFLCFQNIVFIEFTIILFFMLNIFYSTPPKNKSHADGKRRISMALFYPFYLFTTCTANPFTSPCK